MLLLFSQWHLPGSLTLFGLSSDKSCGPFRNIRQDGGLAHLPETATTTTSFLRPAIRMTAAAFTTRQVGAKFTLDYRCFIVDGAGKVVSPFHDLPLYHDEAAGIRHGAGRLRRAHIDRATRRLADALIG